MTIRILEFGLAFRLERELFMNGPTGLEPLWHERSLAANVFDRPLVRSTSHALRFHTNSAFVRSCLLRMINHECIACNIGGCQFSVP